MSNVTELKSQLKDLNEEYRKIRELPVEQRKDFGEKLNQCKRELLQKIQDAEHGCKTEKVEALDISAPGNVNQPLPRVHLGSKHPLMTELDRVIDIYSRMGFAVVESRQLDDEFHMFESLNFPDGHPARDGFDTFRTREGFIPPAHTSTMQYRVLRQFTPQLEATGQLAVVVPGRTFRNEDVDATHEHTFYQCEGVYVSRDANLGQMLGLLRNFFEAYYGQKLNVRTQPAYFPFTEPSLEFLIERPSELGGDGWLEMLGCGMIHPNVLRQAGINPDEYKGFAWGGGIDRLVMLKYRLTDIRYFESGKLAFLEEF